MNDKGDETLPFDEIEDRSSSLAPTADPSPRLDMSMSCSTTDDWEFTEGAAKAAVSDGRFVDEGIVRAPQQQQQYSEDASKIESFAERWSPTGMKDARTSSVLSDESLELEGDTDHGKISKQLQRQTSIQYMEEASMEAVLHNTPSQYPTSSVSPTSSALKIHAAGRQGEQGKDEEIVVLRNTDALVDESMELNLEPDGNTDNPHAYHQQASFESATSLQGSHHDTFQSVQDQNEPMGKPIFSPPTSSRSKRRAGLQRRFLVHASSSLTVPEGNEDDDDELGIRELLTSSEYSILSDDTTVDDDPAVLLHLLFDGFCRPALDLATIQQVLAREDRQDYTSTASDNITFPDQSILLDPSRIIRLLSAGTPSQPVVLRLPLTFIAALFRLLIRLLTYEEDVEYNGTCFLAQPVVDASRPLLKLVEDESPTDPDHAMRRPHLMYTMARLQQDWNQYSLEDLKAQFRLIDDDRPSLQVLWNLWVQAVAASSSWRNQRDVNRVLAPMARLMGLVSVAGMSPWLLRRMLAGCRNLSSTSNHVNNVARMSLVRAIRTAAVGAARPSVMSKIPQQHFFSLDGSAGLQRTITGLSTWPFRNDFGLAVWFRAENVSSQDAPVLLNVRTDDGGGIQVSLVPLQQLQSENACTVAVSIFDSDRPEPVRTITVHGCVLLPRVWYHLAVRHTRSRLKGVFSLSTRQQLSIMLDGKVLLTDALAFPCIAGVDGDDSASSFFQASLAAGLQQTGLRRATSHSYSRFNVVMSFGARFRGQTGTLYVFNDHVSDASFRALYESTGGNNNMTRRSASLGQSWDPRRSEIVRKSRVLDVNITTDDAEEIVLSHRRPSGSNMKALEVAVIDIVDGDEDGESLLPVGLHRAQLGSRIFLTWNPRRAISNLVVDLHVGAHLSLDDRAFAWHSCAAQDAIGSIGGAQALIPVARSLLVGESDTKPLSELYVDGTEGDDAMFSPLPDIFKLLASFVHSHDDNARELLRCGGVDVIEQLIFSNRKSAGGKYFRAVDERISTAFSLVQSILELRAACVHYVGLETKVFSRIVFNIPLWLGATSTPSEGQHSLSLVLLPTLSSITKAIPEKVRDCVGISDMVQMIKECHDMEWLAESGSMCLSSPKSPSQDILLGMIFDVLSSGVTPAELAPFVNFMSASFDPGTLTACDSDNQAPSDFMRPDRSDRLHAKCCATFFFLLQLRPPVSGLFESYVSLCGDIPAAIGWIFACMVKSFDDEVRSFGVRSVAAFLDVTSRSPDAPLIVGAAGQVPTTDSESHYASAQMRGLGIIAKGFAAMSPGARSIVAPPINVTASIVVKLLWHLLKSQRDHSGGLTRAALLCWISDDNGVLLSSYSSRAYLHSKLVSPSTVIQPGFSFDMDWGCRLLCETGKVVGRSLSDALALAAVLRLLRFLDFGLQVQWISDILVLAKASRKSMALLSACPEWQNCLFVLISDALELLGRARSSKQQQAGIDALEVPSNAQRVESDMELVARRVDLCLELYSSLLGFLIREGGDKALDAVEQAASLQRICVNGLVVFFMILSNLCCNLFDHGTLRDISSMSAADWREIDIEYDSPLLKQSARLVTDAILSNGTKGLDLTTAVRSWRSLRHLTETIVAASTSCGLGIVDLFDYANERGSAVDTISGGLRGMRLLETRLGAIQSSQYLAEIEASSPSGKEYTRDITRRFCTTTAAQILVILDSFMFPESLDEALPASQLHGLGLVRSSEPRLGTSKGPLLFSAVRLSVLLLCNLEPCSARFLQAVGRLRSLLLWILELIREPDAENATRQSLTVATAQLDRLVLAVVLHSHRALGRCSSLISEVESSSYALYFETKDSQKKHHRRLLRAAMELRDIVVTAYRGRTDVFHLCLSPDALEALRTSLEGSATSSSKEGLVREFLQSTWVGRYQDVETRAEMTLPEQICIPGSGSDQLGLGAASIDALSKESQAITADFEKALDFWFEDYLERQRKWAANDAVRDLESYGEATVRLLAERHVSDTDLTKTVLLRRNGADNRWRGIQRKADEPWENQMHWMLAPYTDRNGRRTLLVPNRDFTDHADASYELVNSTEGHAKSQLLDKELSDVMRRHADAFTVTEPDDDSEHHDGSSISHESDGESSLDAHAEVQLETKYDSEPDEEWDKIETEEIKGFVAEGDVDSWAKTFIWSDSETVVARFDTVMLVSLRSYVEGNLLLTTHGLYFRQVGHEIGSITRAPVTNINEISENRNRRWRLARLTEIHGRRYMLRPQALELFFSDSHELFVNFPSGAKERDRFHAKLRNGCKIPMLWSPKSLNPRVVFRKSRLTEMWKKRKLSNFDYLMALNRMAGRSFNDITQYVVFPWILVDYTSDEIDLSDSRVYRDLSKPIGALNPDRLAQLIERYNELELFGFTEAEKFLYGSHYSSPGTVLHYLIRQEPFTSMAIELQSGRLDCPDRLFFDLAGSWNSSLTSTSDMKELIPEFFSLPEMFLNTNNFPLGRTQGGRSIDNVTLPPWAKGSPYEFVRIHRLALESEHVSQTLHHWVDLIFGYKQRGPESELAHNVFHHLSYEGSVDLDKIADEVDRQAAESHIQNFGQTPGQLIVAEAHPKRHGIDVCWRPLIYDLTVPKRLRCHTPSKQFGNMRSEHAKGAVMAIHVQADTIFAVYADLSIGTYRWLARHRTNRLKTEKLRPLSRRESSTSRTAIKRGSAISERKMETSCRSIGNWSFAVTVGGLAKEELRRKVVMPPTNRLIAANSEKLTSAETSCLLVSCGYWDDTVRVHSTDSLRQIACERGGHQAPVRCLAMGQDGGLMVTGGHDGTCCIWVVDHPDMSVALSDGYVQTVLGASNDGEQLLSCCHVLWGHDSPVTCVALDSDLDVTVSGCLGGVISVHTIRRGEFIRSFRPPSLIEGKPSGGVAHIAMHSTGNIVIHMNDGGLHTFTINGVRLCSIDADERLNDMKICSQGEILVTGGMKCQVLIRTVSDLLVRAMLDLSRHGPIRCIGLTAADLNPTPQFLFIGSDDGMITIVDEDPQVQKDGQAPGGFLF